MKSALSLGIGTIIAIIVALFVLVLVLVIYFSNTGGIPDILDNISDNMTLGEIP